MKDVIATILTDEGQRDIASVENSFIKQAVAAPWVNAEAE